MAKPATEARLAAAANGFTQVLARGNSHIITKNPTTGKCAYDGQVGGGWHYNGEQETDTAWEADADQNYLKMVKAGYNLRARKLFNAGDLIQWTDPVSGQYVKFQPANFQWIDGTTGSNSLISVAKAVASPSIDDDKLYWPAAFGAGRHFRYTAAPTKLIKHLIIDSAANLPACPSYITDPWLELTFTLTPSSGVVMYVDGVAWDRAKSKTTANAIEFRLPSGQVVWSMAAPTAYDSSEMGEQCTGQIRLYKNKKVKYCSVRFPKAWIDDAQFPIVLDPTVNYQVSAGADDGRWYNYNYTDYYNNNTTVLQLGTVNTDAPYNIFVRFPAVSIPRGATITNAYIQFCYAGVVGTPPTCDLYLEDADSPAAPSSYSDAAGRTPTTETIQITVPTGLAFGDWWNSNDFHTIVQEVVDRAGWTSGNAMQVLIYGPMAAGQNYGSVISYDNDPSSATKLHIEYTEAASGNPFYAYAQQ